MYGAGCWAANADAVQGRYSRRVRRWHNGRQKHLVCNQMLLVMSTAKSARLSALSAHHYINWHSLFRHIRHCRGCGVTKTTPSVTVYGGEAALAQAGGGVQRDGRRRARDACAAGAGLR